MHNSKEHGSSNGSPHEEMDKINGMMGNGGSDCTGGLGHQRYPLGDSGQLPSMLHGMQGSKDPSTILPYPASALVASSHPFSIKSLIPGVAHSERGDVNKYDLMQHYGGYFGALSGNPGVQDSFYNPIYHHLPAGNAS